MPPQRPKRLPTDFFDRLLSNQSDDGINDLLNSLVDEQISPIAEPGEGASSLQDAQPGAAKRHGMPRDKIEDAIMIRDEELEEEPLIESPGSPLDELIPRTHHMQSTSTPSTPVPAETTPEVRPGWETPEAFTLPDTSLAEIQIPEVPEPPLGEEDQEEPSSRVVSAPPPGLHGAPDLIAPEVPEPPKEWGWGPPTVPEEPLNASDAAALFEVETPPTAKPRAPQPSRVPQPSRPPAAPLAPVPTHEQLRHARMQARWEKPKRKPKVPKMAKFTPPITVAPSRLAYLDSFLGETFKTKAKFHFSKIQRAAVSFLLPAFIGFSLFSWYPMLKGLLISFCKYDPSGNSSFVGVANYTRAFQDDMFWSTLIHAGGFCLMIIALGFWLPILLSIFINELRWGKGFLKFIFFLPFLMPTVPAAILWKWIMDQGFGLLNALLAIFPLADPHVGWLTNPKLALLSIACLYIWKNTGWAMLIYFAALSNIDETLYEEAETNGASLWDKVRHVTLPAMRSIIAVMLIITVINTLQLFTEVYIMTNGGPMNATEVIATYIYKQAFFYMDIGYASALSMLLLVMLLFITTFRLRRLDAEVA